MAVASYTQSRTTRLVIVTRVDKVRRNKKSTIEMKVEYLTLCRETTGVGLEFHLPLEFDPRRVLTLAGGAAWIFAMPPSPSMPIPDPNVTPTWIPPRMLQGFSQGFSLAGLLEMTFS